MRWLCVQSLLGANELYLFPTPIRDRRDKMSEATQHEMFRIKKKGKKGVSYHLHDYLYQKTNKQPYRPYYKIHNRAK